MDLPSLLVSLVAEHYAQPQVIRRLEAGVAEVRHGLEMLAALGHLYHLEPGPPLPPANWPRVMFHVDAAPNGRIVRSEWELYDLGEGWWPTLNQAQHDDGVKTQFSGRGGIGSRNVPMVIAPAEPAERRPADLDDRISEWKRANGPPESGG